MLEATEAEEGLLKQPEEAGELESPAWKGQGEGGQRQQAKKCLREDTRGAADVACGEGEHEGLECGGWREGGEEV